MSWTQTRSRIAHAKRLDPNADVSELRQQLKAERMADYIRKAIESAPPLTNEQREILAAMLAPAGTAGGDRLVG